MHAKKNGPLRSALAGQTESWEYLPTTNRPLEDVRGATSAALRHPEDFPSIELAIVDGDAVTIALDPNVPQPAAVLQGVLDALPLQQLGTLVILVGEEATEATVAALQAVAPAGAEVVVHDPDDRDRLGYLAANEAADPIYLNRYLTDADLVLPVTVSRLAGALDPSHESGGVFPMLADTASQQRFRAARLSGEVAPPEAKQAAWLLGFPMLVVVAPTADGEVGRVVAGTVGGIDRALAADAQATWQRGEVQTADVVIACLDGDTQQQSWDNLGRALFVAGQLVASDGTVVILSTIDRRPGPVIRRLRQMQQGDEEAVRRQLLQENHRDRAAGCHPRWPGGAVFAVARGRSGTAGDRGDARSRIAPAVDRRPRPLWDLARRPVLCAGGRRNDARVTRRVTTCVFPRNCGMSTQPCTWKALLQDDDEERQRCPHRRGF